MSETLNEQWIREWMMTAVHTIADNREYLIDLDRHIGDGDHGENMDRGFSAVRDAMERSCRPTVWHSVPARITGTDRTGNLRPGRGGHVRRSIGRHPGPRQGRRRRKDDGRCVGTGRSRRS